MISKLVKSFDSIIPVWDSNTLVAPVNPTYNLHIVTTYLVCTRDILWEERFFLKKMFDWHLYLGAAAFCDESCSTLMSMVLHSSLGSSWHSV